ncbi:transposase family protein, partial [Aeromonas salmonicida]|uniref:transposase family protein n=1 Tax=Aeromonas salmonicida TaxID=645 RepID=UPI0035A59F9A
MVVIRSPSPQLVPFKLHRFGQQRRSEINRKHNLVDVMFLVISAIMSGAEGWNDIETYGDSKIDWL